MNIPFNEDEAADQFFTELLAAVEEQINSTETAYVGTTLNRLITEGLKKEEAKEAIARCLATHADHMVRSGNPFDQEAYRISLDKISPES